MTGPKLIDLFAGCGGMTAGFVEAGFEPVLAVEWDLAAAATYAANFGESHMHWGDIAEVASSSVPGADVVIGGPPCQGFSNLGTRDPADPRNKLWVEFLRVVRAADPKVFVLENVDRFSRSPEFGLLMDSIGDRWRDVEWAVLNAADYGVPQRRQRTILVASRVGPVPLPPPTRDKAAWAGVRSALSAVPLAAEGTDLPRSTVRFFGQTVPGIFKSTELHVGRRPRPLSLERYRHIPPGGGRFDLPDHLLPPCWARKRTGTTDVMGRMRWDAPSLTIRTEFFKPEKGQYLHPEAHRPITHREAALLQSFPPDFVWCGAKLDIARQIGNAVPVRLAHAVAAEVLKAL